MGIVILVFALIGFVAALLCARDIAMRMYRKACVLPNKASGFSAVEVAPQIPAEATPEERGVGSEGFGCGFNEPDCNGFVHRGGVLIPRWDFYHRNQF